MESIGNDINQDDYSRARNKYLEIKWKIMLKGYKEEKEKAELIKQKTELEQEWKLEVQELIKDNIK